MQEFGQRGTGFVLTNPESKDDTRSILSDPETRIERLAPIGGPSLKKEWSLVR